MKVLKKKGVAIAIMVAAILLSSLYGLSRRPQVEIPTGGTALDESLSTAAFAPYVADRAGVLSASQEEAICLYNANWDRLVGGILAVVTVDEAGGDREDAAYDWADSLELGSDDAILLMAVADSNYTVVASGAFYDRLAAQSAGFVDSAMAESFAAGDYGGAALALFGQLHVLISQETAYRGPSAGSAVFSILSIVILLAVLIAVFSILDGIRYSAWNARYGAMGVPPVVYRPILWWHRPDSVWYRRRRTPPPPRGPEDPDPPEAPAAVPTRPWAAGPDRPGAAALAAGAGVAASAEAAAGASAGAAAAALAAEAGAEASAEAGAEASAVAVAAALAAEAGAAVLAAAAERCDLKTEPGVLRDARLL